MTITLPDGTEIDPLAIRALAVIQADDLGPHRVIIETAANEVVRLGTYPGFQDAVQAAITIAGRIDRALTRREPEPEGRSS